MIGRIASFLEDDAVAESSPFGRCESGTRIGLWRRIWRCFCDFPMAVLLQTSACNVSEAKRGEWKVELPASGCTVRGLDRDWAIKIFVPT